MKNNFKNYKKARNFTIILYFFMTTLMFYLSLKQGNNGVTYERFNVLDGDFYWSQALNVAVGKPWIKTSIYPLIIGNLIKITGFESVYLIRMFNYLGVLLLMVFSAKLVEIQFTKKRDFGEEEMIVLSKTIVFLMFSLYASLLMHSSISILRDIWIYALYFASVFLSIQLFLYEKNRFYIIVWLSISLLLLAEFRKYALLSFIVAVVIYVSYDFLRKFKNHKRYLLLLPVLFIFYYIFLIDFKVPIVNMSLNKALSYRNSFLSSSTGSIYGRTQMDINFVSNNVILFVIQYMYSYVGNFIGPLPWHISGYSTVALFLLETLPMLVILRYLWSSRIFLTKTQKYILTHSFVWIGLMSITNDNLGAASRLRPIAWIMIIIVTSVLYAKKKISYSNNNREYKSNDLLDFKEVDL